MIFIGKICKCGFCVIFSYHLQISINGIQHFMLCWIVQGEHIRKNCRRNESKYNIRYIREHRVTFLYHRCLATRRFCPKYAYWYTAGYGWRICCALHANWSFWSGWLIYTYADYFWELTGLILTCGIEYFNRFSFALQIMHMFVCFLLLTWPHELTDDSCDNISMFPNWFGASWDMGLVQYGILRQICYDDALYVGCYNMLEQ